MPLVLWGSWLVGLLYFVTLVTLPGLLLALVFQPAHVVPIAESTSIEEGVSMSRFEYQLATSVDFAPNSRTLTWLLGGLNLQGVHHLFPKIAHEHYFNLRPIVEETAKECGLIYRFYPSWTKGLWEHFKYLHQLGRPPGHPKAIIA